MSKNNSIDNLVDDKTLLNYFCELLNEGKIKFIKQIEKINIYDENIEELKNDNYRNIYGYLGSNKKSNSIGGISLSDLLLKYINAEERILEKENKVDMDNAKVKSKTTLIKEKKIILQRLWPHFVSNAIKFLREKDSRDKGKLKYDSGVKNLKKYFEDFSSFEELLYGIDEYYRDHTLHVFRVYILGEYIVRKYCPKGYNNLEICGNFKSISIEEDEKEAIWCLIALCHDLGFPLQKIDELNKKLVEILKYFGISNYNPIRFSLPFEGTHLDKSILKIISSNLDESYTIHVQSKFFTKFSNSYEKLSHGIMSCILLMKNLVYFKETDYKNFKIGDCSKDLEDVRQYFIRREILRAIASHDTQDIYHFKSNTLAFLLIICDEIQEWNRPAAKKRLFYEIEKKKEMIYLTEFNKKNIKISMTLNFDENDLKSYSITKFQKFISLLRSAVDSDKRTFNFEMRIKNHDGVEYCFIYPSPTDFYVENDKKKMLYDEPIVTKYINGIESSDFTLDNIVEM